MIESHCLIPRIGVMRERIFSFTIFPVLRFKFSDVFRYQLNVLDGKSFIELHSFLFYLFSYDPNRFSGFLPF
jgi:hypothetical protein